MSKKNRVVNISKARVFPINSRAVYSFKGGNPVIDFEIAPTPMGNRLMDVNSLRLNFTLNVKDSGNHRPANQDVRAANAPKKILIDERIGVNGVVSTLRLRNFKNEVIEEITEYGRMLSSLLPAQTSFEAYKNWQSCKSLAFGRKDAEGLAVSGVMACSIPLRSGLTNKGVPLNLNDMDGLKISISLSPSNNFLYEGAAGEADGSSYELSNVVLSYNWLNLASGELPSNEVLQYPTYNSFNGIIQASDDQQSLMLNLSSVRTVFQNFIKTSDVNNYAENSFKTSKITQGTDAKRVKSYVHMRNNVKFNKKYDVDERIAVNNSAFPAFLGREYLNCFRPFNQISACLQAPATENTKTRKTGHYDQPEDIPVYGIGNQYDMLNVGAGVEFKNSMYSMRISSELTDTPNSTYTFTLSNQGLQVKKQMVEPVM